MSSRSILITGCSSGIGRHAAETLRRRGYRVIATARGDDDVRRLRDDGFYARRLDLDRPETIDDALRAALQHGGGELDALFNNAGFGLYGAVEDIGRDALRAQFETNLFGVHDLTRRAAAQMRRQRRGRIVQNSSILGLVATPYKGAYSASKAALEALSDALRLELRGSGVFVSLIEPGPITSRFGVNADAAIERYLDPEALAAGPHAQRYARLRSRLRGDSDGAAGRFRLGPEAVTRTLIDALENPNPKPRYAVTRPAQAMTLLRRVLPTRLLDRLLAGRL